jgi:hypothetical protein
MRPALANPEKSAAFGFNKVSTPTQYQAQRNSLVRRIEENLDIMASVPPLKRSSPEAEGIPSSAVAEFVRAVEQHVHPMDAVQGFMLLRHGNVVAEGCWTP